MLRATRMNFYFTLGARPGPSGHSGVHMRPPKSRPCFHEMDIHEESNGFGKWNSCHVWFFHALHTLWLREISAAS